MRALLSQLALVWAAILLLGCSSGGGNDSSSADSAANSPPPDSFISGNATKGILSNATVSVYGISNGIKDALLASTNTDANGDYSVVIAGTYDGPALVEISAKADGSTLMTCDSVDGCGSFNAAVEYDTDNDGNIDFGEKFSVEAEFVMRAAAPTVSSGDTLSIAVTPLTEMAAAYAENFPQGFDGLSIDSANSQVASLFDLNASILSLLPIDITNLDGSASTDALQYSVLAASLMDLDENATVTENLNRLANSFRDNNGQLISNSALDGSVTLAELAESAVSIATQLNLAGISTELAELVANSNGADAGSVTNARPSPQVGSTELTKVKAFVQDLRTWQNVTPLGDMEIDLPEELMAQQALGENLETMVNSLSVASQWATFTGLPDLATNYLCGTLGDALSVLLCRTFIGGSSLEELCDLATADIDSGGFNICSFVNNLRIPVGDGLTVHFKLLDKTVSFSGRIGDSDIDIRMESQQTTSSAILLTFSGSMENDAGTITFSDGQATMEFENGISATSLSYPETAAITMTVSMEQFATENAAAVSFEGTLQTSLDFNDLLDTSNFNPINMDNRVFDQGIGIGIDLAMAGTLTNEVLDTFTASVDLSGNGQGEVSLSSSLTSADQSIIADSTLSGSLSDILGGLIDIDLNHDGSRLSVQYLNNNGSQFEISNQDGILLAYNQSENLNNGVLKIGEQILGTISHADGVYSITYGDGTSDQL